MVVEIQQRLKGLDSVWEELKSMALSRRKKVKESINYQQFLTKIEEVEAQVRVKQQLLPLPWDSVDDQGSLKCTGAQEVGQQPISERNRHVDCSAQRIEQHRDEMYNMGRQMWYNHGLQTRKYIFCLTNSK